MTHHQELRSVEVCSWLIEPLQLQVSLLKRDNNDLQHWCNHKQERKVLGHKSDKDNVLFNSKLHHDPSWGESKLSRVSSLRGLEEAV